MKLIKLLFTTFALLLCSGVVFAHDFEQDGIYYNILSETDKTVEVTFKGDGYSSYINEYSGSEVIPESVTNGDVTYKVISIGRYAFYGCSSLTSVVIPDAVTSIGYQAFYSCSNLSSVTIGKGVTSIGDYAFYNCDSLTNIIIPDSVTIVGSKAFYSCSNLSSLTIGKGVTSIGSDAFKNCSKLDTIINYSPLTITEGSSKNGYVGYYADKVVNADEQVGNFFFKTIDGIHYLCDYLGNDKDLELPENYNGNSYAIGDYAFYYCHGLTSIVIPDAVTSIGKCTFYCCI